MNIWCLILFLILPVINCLANVWQGDYIIESQADADAFPSICDCLTIQGSLIITGNDLQHVDSLYKLIFVNENLEILNTKQFKSFKGLRYIQSIKKDLVFKNNHFTVIEGFEELHTIYGNFLVTENENLEEINGFSYLKSVKNNIHIKLNPKLIDFTLFKNLIEFYSLLFWKNESLKTISEPDILTEIGQLSIEENNNLIQIAGFNKVGHATFIRIRYNPKLRVINAFQNLANVHTSITINSNDQLEQLIGFDELKDVPTSFEVGLPESMLAQSHFKNLTTVGNHFSSNISNFEKLDSVGEFRLVAHDFLQPDTLTGPFNLKKIGKLVIHDNIPLAHIKGFKSLKQVVQFSIQNNPNLRKIEGFGQLEKIESENPSINRPVMSVANNGSLETITGFESFKQMNGDLNISSNNSLTNITAFDQLELIVGNTNFGFPIELTRQSNFKNLKRIDGELISNATHFNTLENVAYLDISEDILNEDTLSGFESLKKVTDINIFSNQKLKHITAFPALEVASIIIESNKNLLTIAGFNKIHKIENNLEILSNKSLKNITGFEQLDTINNEFRFYNNYNIKKLSSFNKFLKVGNLYIQSNDSLTDISGFEKLKIIDSKFEISKNPILKKIAGFQNLSSVYGTFLFSNNQNITDLSCFNNLKNTNSLYTLSNSRLENITGFQNLRAVINLKIKNNNLLLRLPEFKNLESAGGIEISGNTNLQEINAFKNLTKLSKIDITANNNLLSIEGFDQVSSLLGLNIGNENLRAINAFENLKVVNNLSITNNIHLRSIDNFSNLGFVKNLLEVKFNVQLNNCCIFNCLSDPMPVNVHIINNGMKCSDWQTIKSSCSSNDCTTEEETFTDLKIVNNLISQQLTFSYIAFEDQPANYSIYNINDQLIQKGTVESDLGFNEKTIDISYGQKGYYFLMINNENIKEVVRFVKV